MAMRTAFLGCTLIFFLLSSPALGGPYDGRWKTEDANYGIQIEIHACEVETPDGVHMNARLFDINTETYYMLEGKEHVYKDVVLNEEHSEYKGNFYGPGYPIFSGPGFNPVENCFNHDFKWTEDIIIFRCNARDYVTVNLYHESGDMPSDEECFLLGSTSISGVYNGTEIGDFVIDICLDRMINSFIPFRFDLGARGLYEEFGYMYGIMFLNGIVGSGQFYFPSSNISEPGLPVLIISTPPGILFIEGNNTFAATFVSQVDIYSCDYFEHYGSRTTGTYLTPFRGLPEVFVCETNGILTAMYSYVGVFVGTYSTKLRGYMCQWLESGYPVHNISGTALLFFENQGIRGEAYTKDGIFSIYMPRIARGIPPPHLCLREVSQNLQDAELTGLWTVPPNFLYSFCSSVNGTFNASYGIGKKRAEGGFETGVLHPQFPMSSGVFYEPANRGYTLSILAGPDTLYNLYVYDHELKMYSNGFTRTNYGMTIYNRLSAEVHNDTCNTYSKHLYSSAFSPNPSILALFLCFVVILFSY